MSLSESTVEVARFHADPGERIVFCDYGTENIKRPNKGAFAYIASPEHATLVSLDYYVAVVSDLQIKLVPVRLSQSGTGWKRRRDREVQSFPRDRARVNVGTLKEITGQEVIFKALEVQLGLPRKRKRSFEFYRQPDQWMALAGGSP